MAETTKHNLRLSVAAAVIRQLADVEPDEQNKFRRSALRVAAALVELAEGKNPGREGKLGNGSLEAETAFEEWRTRCAEVLSALAYPLQELEPALAGEVPCTDSESLARLTRTLAEQTGRTSDSLSEACGALRSQGGRLLQQASQLGAIARATQLERLRLTDDLRQAESLGEQLVGLGGERAAIALRVESLNERLQLANSTPEVCRNLELEVDRRETQAAALSERLKGLERKKQDLQEQCASLENRIRETEQLIEEVERSSDRELLLTVQAIWRAVRAKHSHQA
jgi:DNA repair exonuclease SbcCD ATPase subunit